MHTDDEKWVSSQIAKCDNPKYVLDKYNEVFKEVYMSEPCKAKRMNKARREANTRLRAYMAKKGL